MGAGSARASGSAAADAGLCCWETGTGAGCGIGTIVTGGAAAAGAAAQAAGAAEDGRGGAEAGGAADDVDGGGLDHAAAAAQALVDAGASLPPRSGCAGGIADAAATPMRADAHAARLFAGGPEAAAAGGSRASCCIAWSTPPCVAAASMSTAATASSVSASVASLSMVSSRVDRCSSTCAMASVSWDDSPTSVLDITGPAMPAAMAGRPAFSGTWLFLAFF